MGRLNPRRGEVWYVSFDPVVGHEQGGTRPALIVSSDWLGASPSELVIALAITSRERGMPSHVRVEPPEGGLRLVSFIKCEDIRSVSKQRLGTRLGSISESTIAQVEIVLRTLLEV